MGRKKLKGFTNPKMFSARVEQEDYDKFIAILKHRDGMKLQEALNMFISEYISGTIVPVNSHFEVQK